MLYEISNIFTVSKFYLKMNKIFETKNLNVVEFCQFFYYATMPLNYALHFACIFWVNTFKDL